MMELMHVSLGVTKECRNPDSYGCICVRCNRCGRFTAVPQVEPVKPVAQIRKERGA